MKFIVASVGHKMPGWTRREDFDWFSTLADPEA